MKSKILKKSGWIVAVLAVLIIFVYFFYNSSSVVTTDPNIITVTEGTQGFKDNIRIGVANIQNGSGVVYLTSQTENTSRDVKTGDNFDFLSYNIQVIEVKDNNKALPPGFTGGSNGSIILKIINK